MVESIFLVTDHRDDVLGAFTSLDLAKHSIINMNSDAIFTNQGGPDAPDADVEWNVRKGQTGRIQKVTLWDTVQHI